MLISVSTEQLLYSLSVLVGPLLVACKLCYLSWIHIVVVLYGSLHRPACLLGTQYGRHILPKYRGANQRESCVYNSMTEKLLLSSKEHYLQAHKSELV